MITSGTSSDEYANREGKLISRALVNEMPYFYDQRIDDTTPSDMIRREAVLINCDQTEAFFAALTPLYERVKPLIRTWNHLGGGSHGRQQRRQHGREASVGHDPGV